MKHKTVKTRAHRVWQVQIAFTHKQGRILPEPLECRRPAGFTFLRHETRPQWVWLGPPPAFAQSRPEARATRPVLGGLEGMFWGGVAAAGGQCVDALLGQVCATSQRGVARGSG